MCAEYVCVHFHVCILWVWVQTHVCLSTHWVKRWPWVSVLTLHLDSDRVFCLPLSPAGQPAPELLRILSLTPLPNTHTPCSRNPGVVDACCDIQLLSGSGNLSAHLTPVQQALSPRAISLSPSLTASHVSGSFMYSCIVLQTSY